MRWTLLLLQMVLWMTASAAQPAGPYGPELEGFDYPFPVQRHSLDSQGQVLSMAFMDVAPAVPNGRTVVLLHGKNFCAATWGVTIARLAAAGFRPGRDAERGLDHGVFIPLMLIRPQADIPVLQLSILDDLDPERHLRLGAALSDLRDDGVLIIGSGMSFHNLRTFFSPIPDPGAEAFDDWLALCLSDPSRREAALAGWSGAPGARASHPREEHLLPLMVCAGAAKGEPARRIFRDVLMGKPVSAFRFG